MAIRTHATESNPDQSGTRGARFVPQATSRSPDVGKTCTTEAETTPAGRNRLLNYLHAVRPHHWFKNALVFLPLLTAHRLYEREPLENALIALVAFTLCASSVYLLNDLLDLEADRRHPRKRLRPLASGRIGIVPTLVLMPLLLIAAIATGFVLRPAFLVVLGVYYVTMVIYSLGAKRVPILDVLMLASGYALRVVAGSVAAGITPSAWLAAFCLFLFFSLALTKRYAELVTARVAAAEEPRVLGYLRGDGILLLAQGIASGYLAVLVLALHTNTTMVQALAGRYELFWLICLLLLYWISYLWLMAHRGRIEEDPVAYALKDRMSRSLMILIAAIAMVAT